MAIAKKSVMPILHYSLKKGKDIYIARCVELPAVMAYGKTPKEITSKLNLAIHSYLDAFPNEKPMMKNQEVKELTITPV